jgi:hypothetical protein
LNIERPTSGVACRLCRDESNIEVKKTWGGSGGWTDNADQLSWRVSREGDSRINALGESARIGIIPGADDESGVSALGISVEADEIQPVQGEHGTVLLRSERQDLIVWDFLVGSPGFIGREHIVPETAEFLDDPLGKILVGIERGHHAS